MSLPRSFVRKDSYWGDAINSLFLRPPYRAPHPGFDAREEVVLEEKENTVEEYDDSPDPVKPAEKHVRYRYTIDVDELEYAVLMRIVMKYGTGAGYGGSTPVGLRVALADAEIRSVN